VGRFDGKTALVTGGTSGIGLATARGLALEGARVLITGTSEPSIARGLAILPAGVIGMPALMQQLPDIAAIAHRVAREFGSLDVVVLCAGVMRTVPLADVTEATFDEVFDVNVKGTFFCVQKLAPLLRQGASVVLLSSGAAEMGRVGRGMYAASKAATRQLARSLAAELVHRGVRVNAVSPGPTLTPLNIPAGTTAEDQATLLASKVPLGRVGQPDDIARAILFLASDESAFMLGSELVVDGGWRQLGEVP
jgi:NAD(P)-dependent dehydrogenase (short-subunit alcohol dehydrogenase family)